jgi:hypothetical protein
VERTASTEDWWTGRLRGQQGVFPGMSYSLLVVLPSVGTQAVKVTMCRRHESGHYSCAVCARADGLGMHYLDYLFFSSLCRFLVRLYSLPYLLINGIFLRWWFRLSGKAQTNSPTSPLASLGTTPGRQPLVIVSLNAWWRALCCYCQCCVLATIKMGLATRPHRRRADGHYRR